ncbi:UNVERIFIED_CONTAM: hypothetical protein FKN15_010618 [Acipenser sinensis]
MGTTVGYGDVKEMEGDGIAGARRSAQRETAESKNVFDDLMDSIQKKKYAVVELIEAKEKTALIEVEGLRKKIQQEINELRRQNNEIEQLSETEDNIQFLKNPLPISVPCGIGGEPRVPFNATFNFEAERKAVSALKGYLEDIWKKESGKIPKTDFHQLTFDPNTTNKHILLSEENRKATWRAKFLQYPDHPERFDGWNQLLNSEGLVGKRYYWEVECTGKEIEIGVTYKGIARKEWNDSSHIGRNLLSWSLEWNQDGYFAWHNNEMSSLSAPRSQKLGVYLDYPAGTLSFYSITDTITLLHRFHTTFTEPLYAGFKVGYVSSAQICARVDVLCHRYT